MTDIQYGTIDIPKIERPENLSPAEIDRRAAASRYSRAQAQIEADRAKEEALQKRIAEATERSVSNNQSLRHGGATRMTITRERDTSRDVPLPRNGYVYADPGKVAVTVNGVGMSAEQAKAYLADGTVTRQQYSDAVTAAMQPYQPGYKHSFR
jgi:hypothetical protein